MRAFPDSASMEEGTWAPEAHRGWVALLAICTVVLCAGAATPAWAVKEYDLPSHITIETVPLPGDNDPNRCVAWAFAEFPVIPGAKGYELTVLNTRDGTRQTFSGPPFPDDHWDDYPAQFKVHKGFHWFALSGYSTGTGCADAILAFEGAYKIVRSRVSRETKPKDTKPKEPTCETLYTRAELKQAKPRGVKLDLPLPGLDLRGKPALVNRWGRGQVFTIDPDSNQPVQVNRQRYMREGRIITSPQGGFVDISSPRAGPRIHSRARDDDRDQGR